MYIVIFFSTLALFLTFLSAKGIFNGGMKLGFVLVTTLAAIHYDYGNDYMGYYNIYKNVTMSVFDWQCVVNGEYYKESGWALLCWAFKPLGGFFTMVATLSIIQNFIVYRFIKRYVEKKWWTLAVFIYLFSTSFYLLSFSMLRQEFVMIVLLGLWKYISNRKWLVPLVVMYLCSFIHSSALILLPFVFWGFVPINNQNIVKILVCVYLCALLVLWFYGDVLNDLFRVVLSLDDDIAKYEDIYEDSEQMGSVGIGFFINMLPLVLSLFFLMSKRVEYDTQEKLQVAFAIIAFLIVPFGQIIALVSRVGMYFEVLKISAIPLVYANIKNTKIRTCFLSVFVLITLYDYYVFFHSPVFSRAYAEFKTIFSVL